MVENAMWRQAEVRVMDLQESPSKQTLAAREEAWTDSPSETPEESNPADTWIPDF